MRRHGARAAGAVGQALKAVGRTLNAGIDAVVAVLHDGVLFGILRLTSPRFRAHQAYVRTQTLHLNGMHAQAPVDGCAYCTDRLADGR